MKKIKFHNGDPHVFGRHPKKFGLGEPAPGICALLPWARGHLVQRAKIVGTFLPLNKKFSGRFCSDSTPDKKLAVQNKWYF